ncbi:MAG TPA: molybdenum cofactor guanylyltransferase, partial [Alphaproteobacteria bacterium]|nr:molybdenum cofactor guanylyltransferase [Alphaproteobacteria bacterium]
GGRSSRMGRDKAAVRLGDRTLQDLVHARLAPQVDRVVVSKRTPEGPETIGDPPGIEGPLAGILAGLEYAVATGAAFVAFAPTDTPFVPAAFVARARAALVAEAAEIALGAHGGRVHHAVGLWRAELVAPLRAWVVANTRHSVRDFAGTRRTVAVDFPGAEDPFLNINTETELAAARARLAAGGDS